MQETEAFISVKYHKVRFPNSPSFRQINPSKSEIGKISKHILDKINQSLLSNTKVNQWKNSSDAISWFKNINKKKQSSANITEQDLSIIIISRKTLLFQNSE